jgi:hypothetical protein
MSQWFVPFSQHAEQDFETVVPPEALRIHQLQFAEGVVLKSRKKRIPDERPPYVCMLAKAAPASYTSGGCRTCRPSWARPLCLRHGSATDPFPNGQTAIHQATTTSARSAPATAAREVSTTMPQAVPALLPTRCSCASPPGRPSYHSAAAHHGGPQAAAPAAVVPAVAEDTTKLLVAAAQLRALASAPLAQTAGARRPHSHAAAQRDDRPHPPFPQGRNDHRGSAPGNGCSATNIEVQS